MAGAVLRTTEGAIELELFPEDAPKTVENFTKLASEGYYDGLTFHRVIPDFMTPRRIDDLVRRASALPREAQEEPEEVVTEMEQRYRGVYRVPTRNAPASSAGLRPWQ